MLESPLHEHHLLRFDVEIEDKPVAGTEAKNKRTATIIFYDESNKRVSSYVLTVMAKEQIYALIDQGEAIYINNTYVKDFSLKEYRSLRGIEYDTSVKLKNFSAKKTFFDCDLETDFSYAEFEGERTVFESAIFGNGFSNFYSANFGHGSNRFFRWLVIIE